MAFSVSVKVPIWFTLIRMELAEPEAMLFSNNPHWSQQVVTDDLAFGTDFIGQQFKAVPVVFRHPVFNGNRWGTF